MKYIIWAISLGALSALSLPLGSLIGLKFKFKPGTLAILAAFGAGALLAALAVELIAPTTLAISGGNPDSLKAFIMMVIGCILGGFVYVLLDQLISKQGGYKRKVSTLLTHFKKRNKEQQEKIIQEIASIRPFETIPPEEINKIIPYFEVIEIEKGDVLVREGQPAQYVFVIASGSLSASIEDEEIVLITREHGLLNLNSVITLSKQLATAIAQEKTVLLRISAGNLSRMREAYPAFSQACIKVAKDGLTVLDKLMSERSHSVHDWVEESISNLDNNQATWSLPAIHKRVKNKSSEGSPLAIWLGILIDGIPESLVIGAGMMGMIAGLNKEGIDPSFASVVPYTLIAGLFLSNFPEALSSSSNMKAFGMKDSRIFTMWFSLMVITGLGSGLGYYIADIIEHSWIIFLEGLASGAMLTMIAAAMIPEAVHMSKGNTVGLSTLAGFVSAILFKLFE